MDFGTQLKKYRKEANFTQQGLAKESGISRTYLSDVENNRYNPSVDFIKKVSNALSIKLDLDHEDKGTLFESLMNSVGYSLDDNKSSQSSLKIHDVNILLDSKDTFYTVMGTSFRTIKTDKEKSYNFKLAVSCTSGDTSITGVINCLFKVATTQQNKNVFIQEKESENIKPSFIINSSFIYSFATDKEIESLQSDSSIFKQLELDQPTFIKFCDFLDEKKVKELINTLLDFQIFNILYNKGLMLSGKGSFAYDVEANWLNKYFLQYYLTTKETIEFKSHIEISDNQYM